MENISLEDLRKLNKSCIELDKKLKEINALLDNAHENIDYMASITERTSKAFELYRELLKEMNL